MNPMMGVPMDLQLHLHQQMLFKQEQLALRGHETEETIGLMRRLVVSLGAGGPLPREVKVELQNWQLWRQFHNETTEMIITKPGRRMFPSIQVSVTGLERRAYYRVVLEVAPASDRRHKYLGGGEGALGREPGRGWTSAGPAEPQPRIERRIYQHPDGLASGAHWMQHPISFKKLKLTNNAVDHRNNVVLTSMHKYVPRIWIIRCDDSSRIGHADFYPASSFTFTETEFIAVTAYQNENITKLKIYNNPFAKGFRETGQSRYKRKYRPDEVEAELDGEGEREPEEEPRVVVDRSIGTAEEEEEEEEEGNTSSSESESARAGTGRRTGGGRELTGQRQRPRTASSETGSLDDSGVSSYGGASPSPARNSPSRLDQLETGEPQPRLHRPWLDCSSKVPGNSQASGSGSLHCPNSIYELSLAPVYPYGLLRPSFHHRPDYARLQFHSFPQISRFH